MHKNALAGVVMTKPDSRIDVYLVVNARYHDTNFARLELLKLLAEQADVWVHVAADFSDIETLSRCRTLITYTCDLCPTLDQQKGLQTWLQAGGRWLALHATNALIGFVNGKADTPDRAPLFMTLLGSRFIAHPAITKFTVRVADPTHPLVAGLTDFEAEDEPYYCEYTGSPHVLLEASYNQPSTGYVRSDYGTDRASHPQMYLHRVGDGEVLYLTLGHCCGKYDMRPLANEVPIHRGSWKNPVFYELLRRSIAWNIRQPGA
jgi:type 1 glutamine amidotransferase